MERRESAVAIGTFDGVHRGHRALIATLASTARRRGLRSVVVALERPVRQVPGLLATPAEKAELLSALSVDEVIILPVDDGLVRQPAITFLAGYLAGGLRARHVVVGRNFAFGHARHGTVAWLTENARDLGIRTTVVPPVRYRGAVISSSRIRSALLRGRVGAAARLLGRFYAFSGKRVTGRRVARRMGFPTINLSVDQGKLLPRGVFACCVARPGRWVPGVVNIGTRPTFALGAAVVPEVHLLEGDDVPGGNRCTVQLIKHVRSEIIFKNKHELASQIAQDVRQVRAFFNGSGAPGLQRGGNIV